MKNAWIAVLVTLAVFGCSKNHSTDSESQNNSSGLIIKGSISRQGLAKGSTRCSDSLASTAKVLLLSQNYSKIVDIHDTSFSLTANIGTGVALLFLDSSYKYIGNLSADGLNMLPLGNLSSGENTIIDLSRLTLVGTSVIPSHDPLGNEIMITASEIKSLKATGEFYESIAQNMDANNDGVPDILSQTDFYMYSAFVIDHCGHWGCSDTLPVINDSSALTINYGLHVRMGKNMTFSTIAFSGPADNPYTRIHLSYNADTGNGGYNAYIYRFTDDWVGTGDPPDQTRLPFAKGTYTMTLDGTAYTLQYSNFNVYNNLVLIVPTVHLNSSGQLTSITLTYQLLDGTTVEPKNMMTSVYAQIVDRTTNLTYDVNCSSNLTKETGFSTITPASPMTIPHISCVAIGYQDMLGNTYAVLWDD